MHPELEKKLENYQYLCHSTTIEYAQDILRAGYVENIFATVDRKNSFREGCLFYFTINREEIEEDLCYESGNRIESEWFEHDQVACRNVDFCFNAKLLKIETEDLECQKLYTELKKMM